MSQNFNFSGMQTPTSMFIDPLTNEVLGPSVPLKMPARAAWVEWVDGHWKEITDRNRFPRRKYDTDDRRGKHDRKRREDR